MTPLIRLGVGLLLGIGVHLIFGWSWDTQAVRPVLIAIAFAAVVPAERLFLTKLRK